MWLHESKGCGHTPPHHMRLHLFAIHCIALARTLYMFVPSSRFRQDCCCTITPGTLVPGNCMCWLIPKPCNCIRFLYSVLPCVSVAAQT
jgi:hypothetical protein